MKITQRQLEKILRYSPETGVFVWVMKPNRRIRIGGIAGWLEENGYVRIEICKCRYYAHRLAWLYMTGEWPKEQIDHINGVRSDNRWANLREATRFINAQNQRNPRADNVTGFLGVLPWRNSFQARIGLRGKSHYLGTYHTAEQAHEAYLQAKRRLHEGCTI